MGIGNRALNDEQIKLCRKLWNEGFDRKEIAAYMYVSYKTIVRYLAPYEKEKITIEQALERDRRAKGLEELIEEINKIKRAEAPCYLPNVDAYNLFIKMITDCIEGKGRWAKR